MIIPRVKILYPMGKCPTKAYIGDAGFDVYSACGSVVLGPKERFKFPLGFALELPLNYVGIISEKSGMAVNDGIITIGNIIDCNYRGECHAILFNTSEHPVLIACGQKIAQLLIQPCYCSPDIEIVDELSVSDRSDRGFGSSGV